MDISEIQEDISVVVDGLQSNFQEWLTAQLSNDFLIATIFASLAGVLLFLGRSVIPSIYRYVRRRCVVQVVITSDNTYLNVFAEELDKNAIKFLSRIKSFDDGRMTIGWGRSFSFLEGRFVIVQRDKEETTSHKFKQSLTITIPFIRTIRADEIFYAFIERYYRKNEEKITVYRFASDDYNPKPIKIIEPRTEASVFIDDSIKTHIKKRIKFFQDRKDWYLERGITYKHAFLLHGIPGTGKTSVAKMIATYANRDIIYCSPENFFKLTQFLNYNNDDDDSFDFDRPRRSSNKAKKKYVILLEDIDTFNITKKRREENKKDTTSTIIDSIYSLSDLLNAIDGIFSPEDFILVATTNHIDKIDKALLRKGRFDDLIQIDKLTNTDVLKMIEYFTDKEFVARLGSRTFEPIEGAKLQDIIITNLDNFDDLLAELINISKG